MSTLENTAPLSAEKKPSTQWILLGAFAAIYLVWGSTYLAIKVAVETMPPFLMATARFVIAGAVLYAIARFKSRYRPTLQDWKQAAILGSLLIAGGNGLVTYAETSIDSNVAALIGASGPFFALLFSWWGGLQTRPSRSNWTGISIGFAGVGLLIFSGSSTDTQGSLFGYFLVILAVILWTIASVLSKKRPSQINIWLMSGMQMFCGGLVCLIAGALLGEFNTIDIPAISNRSWLAFVYLVIMGSLLAFTSYIYVLRHCTPAKAASHAYVNPIVAIVLGWLILGETLTMVGGIGATLIIFSVYDLLKQKSEIRNSTEA